MLKASLVAALLVAASGVCAAQAAEGAVKEDERFKRERAYFEPGEAPVSRGVRGLIQSLERARGMNSISSGKAAIRGYSLDTALWERSWRRRVSEELAGLLK